MARRLRALLGGPSCGTSFTIFTAYSTWITEPSSLMSSGRSASSSCTRIPLHKSVRMLLPSRSSGSAPISRVTSLSVNASFSLCSPRKPFCLLRTVLVLRAGLRRTNPLLSAESKIWMSMARHLRIIESE